MKPIEFELERTIRAPIDQVFARLVDIEGHNDWMADTGSMLKHTRQTSPGEPAVGTTFVDETSQGAMPGEIAELEGAGTRSSTTGGRSRSRASSSSRAGLATTFNPPGTARRWSAIAPSCCPTARGDWAHRSGGGSPSRSAPSLSTRSRRPSSRVRVPLLSERLPGRIGVEPTSGGRPHRVGQINA